MPSGSGEMHDNGILDLSFERRCEGLASALKEHVESGLIFLSGLQQFQQAVYNWYSTT